MDSKLKILAAFTLLTLLTGLTTGYRWTGAEWDGKNRLQEDTEIFTYGNAFGNNKDTGMFIRCESGDACPQSGDFKIRMCGTTYSHIQSKTYSDWNGYKLDVPFNPQNFRFFPKDIPCSLGTHTLTLLDGSNTITTHDLTIKPKPNDMNAHKGKYLYIGADLSGGTGEGPPVDKLSYFLLSNHVWGKVTPDGGTTRGSVFWVDYDSNMHDEGAAQGVTGRKLGFGAKNTLKGIVDTSTTATSGHENAIELRDSELSTSVTDNRHLKDLKGELDSWTPVDKNGGYYPEGQLILGHEPDTLGGAKKWFVCRDGATMANSAGATVPQAVDVQGSSGDEIYKCDFSTNKWVSAPECNDGINNDGDSGNTYDDKSVSSNYDTDCDSTTDTNGESPDSTSGGGGSTSCESSLVTVMAQGQLVANWTTDADSCTYEASEKFATWIDSAEANNGKPDRFHCTGTDINGDGVVSTSTERGMISANQSEFDTFCSSLRYDEAYHDDSPTGDNDIVLESVEYYPTYEYLVYQEAGLTAEDFEIVGPGLTIAAAGTTFDSTFEQYGWYGKEQALYQAMEKYSESGKSHDKFYWDNQKGVINSSSDSWGNDNYIQHFVAANTGKDDQKKISDETFEGGFLGGCEGGTTWFNTGGTAKWACSGDVPTTQYVYFPNARTSDNGKEKVGFVIMPYFVNDTLPLSGDFLSYVESEGFDSGDMAPPPKTFKEGVVSMKDNLVSPESDAADKYNLRTLYAACWPGKPSDKPTLQDSTRGTDWFGAKVENIKRDMTQPLPVWGQLELGAKTKYTCTWEYRNDDVNDNVIENEGKVKYLASDGSYPWKAFNGYYGIKETVKDGVVDFTQYADGSIRTSGHVSDDWTSGFTTDGSGVQYGCFIYC